MTLWIGWILGFGLALLLAGCRGTLEALQGVEKLSADIPSGCYVRIEPAQAQPTVVAVDVVGIEIEREGGSAGFILRDGTQVAAPLGQASWGQGCPDMVGATRMEILALDVEELALGEARFRQPALVGNCPNPPRVFVLVEQESLGEDLLTGSVCPWYQGAPCIYFGEPYLQVHGKVVDRVSQELIPDGEIRFTQFEGEQVYGAEFSTTFPGGARIPFTTSAPGYASQSGWIEIGGEALRLYARPGQSGGSAWLVENPQTPLEVFFELVKE